MPRTRDQWFDLGVTLMIFGAGLVSMAIGIAAVIFVIQFGIKLAGWD